VAALGLAVEAVQVPLAYRSSSVADAAANAAGALVGVAAAWLLARVR
jgi:VanZ family protein